MRITKREFAKTLQDLPDKFTIQAKTRLSPGGIVFCDLFLNERLLSVVQQTSAEHNSGDDETIRFRLYEDCARLMYWTHQNDKRVNITLDDEDITPTITKFAKNWIAGMC